MHLSKTTINILLFIAVCILAAGAWIGQKSEELRELSLNSQIASNYSAEKITRIEISNSISSKAILEKRQDKWFMTQPIKIEANAFLASKVTKILSSPFSKKFIPNEDQLLQFGLSPAKFTLTLNDYSVQFGDRSSISNQRYIRYDDSIFLIRDQLLPILNSAPASFISHNVIPLGARIIAITLPDFSLQRQDNKWIMASSKSPQQQLSQDHFIKFIDEWRLSQALYVSLSNQHIDDSKTDAAPIVVKLDQGQLINLIISRNQNGLTLYRPDLGIYYHMHNEAEQKLFTFAEQTP